MAFCFPGVSLGVPSMSILSRDPSFQETIKHPGETAGFRKERWLKRMGKTIPQGQNTSTASGRLVFPLSHAQRSTRPRAVRLPVACSRGLVRLPFGRLLALEPWGAGGGLTWPGGAPWICRGKPSPKTPGGRTESRFFWLGTRGEKNGQGIDP